MDCPIRIMHVRSAEKKENNVGNIFVNNLDQAITEKDLNDTFKCFGDIISCKVARDSKNVSLGYGYVHFAREESANRAIAKVNGIPICGKKITCEPFKRRTDRDQERTNVYVKNYPTTWTEEDVRTFFEKFGTITSIFFPKGEDGKPKGFTMVNFSDKETAAKAVGANEQSIKHTPEGTASEIYISYCQSKDERKRRLKREYADKAVGKRACSLIIKWKGVDSDKIDEEKLADLFSQFAMDTELKSVKIPKIGSNREQGFGFINCKNRDDCSSMIANMNNKNNFGLDWTVEMQLGPGGTNQAANTPQGLGANPMMGSPMMWPYNMPGRMPGMGLPPQQMMMQMNQMNGMSGMNGMNGMNGMGKMPPMAGPPGIGGFPPSGGPPNYRGAQQFQMNGAQQRQMPGVMKRIGEPGQLNPQDLAAVDDATAKQMIGESLYPLVQQRISKTEFAGKITGMLLEMDNTEVLMLLDHAPRLDAKIEEACHIIGGGCQLLRGRPMPQRL